MEEDLTKKRGPVKIKSESDGGEAFIKYDGDDMVVFPVSDSPLVRAYINRRKRQEGYTESELLPGDVELCRKKSGS